MENVYDTLKNRGFIEQLTHEAEIRELLGNEKVTFYIGFDPTADSLHIGHYLQSMTMAHMQRAGHRPIALMGGGTGMVGDPTDKTEMRRMMTPEEIDRNVSIFKKQFGRFIDFSEGKALMLNNADWLMELKYLPFLREYGVHFSVNKMLAAESYKTRLEHGLSFFEFNYQLLQSYDFLELFRKYNCKIQFGGNDQWSNIIAGVELIRKVERKEAYGLTFTLLLNSDGTKMGKTQSGAVWLDADKTSPYEFYQYWRNTEDVNVIKFLKLLTFLPLTEIAAYERLSGSGLNRAKEVLAFEITKNTHGEDEAIKARAAAKALFAGGEEGGSVPETAIEKKLAKNGINLIDLMLTAQLIDSKSEGRRLIEQGGVKINGEKATGYEQIVSINDFNPSVMIQKGKKIFHRFVINN